MRRLATALALLFAAAGGAVLFLRSADAPTGADAPPAVASAADVSGEATPGPLLRLVPGEVWILDARYDAVTRALGPDGHTPLDGHLRFRGDVALHVVSTEAAHTRLEAEIARCEQAEVRVLEQVLLDADADCGAALGGRLAFGLDVRGGVTGTAAVGGTPSLGTRLLEAIVMELFVPLPESAGVGVQVDKPTPRGTSRMALIARAVDGGFEIDGRTDGALGASRLPADAAQVDGRYALSLQDGRPARARFEEAVTGPGLFAEAILEIQRVDVRAGATRTAAEVPRLGLPFTTDQGALEDRLTDQRIDGLTPRDVAEALALVNAGGEVADGRRFVWRATALVGRDPSLAEAVGTFAASDGITTPARAYALDLLAQAGSPEAEAALLDALGSDAARADPHHAVHVQRVSFLRAPSPAVADEVLRRTGSERGALRGAWLASAGSVAAALPADDPARAALHTALRDGLRDEGEALVGALLGIGNAASPVLAESAVPFLSHPVAEVRMAALRAIADGQVENVAAFLATAAADEAAMVQRTALRLLDHGGYAGPAVTAVADLVAAGGLRRDNTRVALDLLKRHGMADVAAARGALARMMDDPRLSGEERAAAQILDEALSRGGWGTAAR